MALSAHSYYHYIHYDKNSTKENNMLAIGLMSGTSCDGVDASLIETDGEVVHRYIADYYLPYPQEFQDLLINLMSSSNYKEWLLIEKSLTQYHITAIKELLKISNTQTADIIGFHGQTILHQPEYGITWQIGNPQLIASTTGIKTIGDFRRRDMANGGQGAPLVPIFHKAIMEGKKLPLGILNIGGVTAFTHIEENTLISYDTGPGNALINDAMMSHYNEPYDKDGIIASQGSIDFSVIDKILQDKFFDQKPPKSLDRNHFSYVMNLLVNHNKANIVATLTALTASAIIRSIPKNLYDIYICGGGGKNLTMVDHIRKGLPNTQISSMTNIGINPDFVESQAFAYLAARYANNLVSSFPTTTGVKKNTLAGVLFLP